MEKNKKKRNLEIYKKDNSTVNFLEEQSLSYYKKTSEMEAPFRQHLANGNIKCINEIIYDIIKEDSDFYAKTYKDDSIIGVKNGLVSIYYTKRNIKLFSEKIREILKNLNKCGYLLNDEKEGLFSFNKNGYYDKDTKIWGLSYAFRISTETIKKES